MRAVIVEAHPHDLKMKLPDLPAYAGMEIEALCAAGPDMVATANPGCAMQLASGMASAGRPTPVVHPIELLEEASRPRSG